MSCRLSRYGANALQARSTYLLEALSIWACRLALRRCSGNHLSALALHKRRTASHHHSAIS